MTMSEAWFLECGNSLALAVCDHEMAEYVQPQQTWVVPGAPEYCASVMIWQNNIVPVMDIAALEGGIMRDTGQSHVCILHYQVAPQQPLQQLAVRVSRPPQKIQVGDEQICDFPASLESGKLRDVTLSCFNHDGLPVLIIDIARLCSDEFREIANAA